MEILNQYQKIVGDAINKYSFKSKPNEFYEPMNYIISLGGKRIRPVMVLMACDMFGGNTEESVKPALAIEFFHNFSLMHDDIMDKAPLRRNKPSVHTLYGINSGILSGDGLVFKAFKFFEDLEPETFKLCLKVFTKSTILVCEGQQYDINFETQQNVTFDDYIKMITYKTAALSSSSLAIGALISGTKLKNVVAIAKFGKHLGIAFQMMDDYLDVFGDQSQLGKKHAGDIYENKKTLLYFLAKKHATESEIKELDYWYLKKTDNIDKVYEVEKIFKKNKVDEKALRLIEKHTEIAQSYLQKTDISEDNKKPFVELANYLLKRES
ncbi:polyprenyl synthetase family protein [Chryseobacterium polytrichastri]|uniref:Geranylgeranyl diphosphate synthase, type II n=1 Tax=Chryseobacterium polytrichastri TaxID=1302687 RepID=A0A1M7KFI1_9FLAO|nr:polyprenyl synthetase family protein [Chryseobacterium polytrichastri]SHM64097.1 geranylgeranyl diphosphate synthase, type II [Chryseobacterium polytrichastri]